jgi:hypothetical protein
MSKILDAPGASSTPAEDWNGDINAGFSEFQEESRASVARETPPEVAPASEPDEPAGAEPVTQKEPLTDEQKSAMKRANNEKRWDKLLRERDDAKAELERLKALKPAEPAAPATAKGKVIHPEDPDDPRPKQDDFTDFDEYVDARSTWNARQVLKAEKASQAAATAKTQLRTQAEGFMGKIGEYAGQHKDFIGTEEEPGPFEIVRDELEDGLQEVSSEIVEHDKPAELIHYLGSHPEALDQILAHRGNPTKALIALGRIIAGFDEPSAPAAPTTKRSLPKPPSPIRAQGHTPSGEAALDAAAEANDFSAFQKTLRSRERKR